MRPIKHAPIFQAAESSYDEETGFCGSLKLALYMDTNLNLLTVSLKQATDLVAKRQDGYPNPYFKVCLDVPDQQKPKTEQQTRVAKNTASPVVEEDFFFQVSWQFGGFKSGSKYFTQKQNI